MFTVSEEQRVMASVDDREKELKDLIYGLRLLRDAQAEGDAHYAAFQAQITEATGRLLWLQREAPRISALESDIELAQRLLADRKVEASAEGDPWRPIAIAGGVLGGVLLLAWLWLGLVSLAVSCVLCVLCGGGALFASIRWRRDGELAVSQAKDELEALLAQRDVSPA